MRHKLARALGLLAAVILVFMMLFTTYAVVQREFFGTPVLGVVDVMELALVACVFIAIPAVFLRDDHIAVDVIDQLVSTHTVRRLRIFSVLLGLVLFASMMFEMLPAALEKYASDEVTMTLSIDRFWHWLPILFCFVVSILALLWVLFGLFRSKKTNPSIKSDPKFDQ